LLKENADSECRQTYPDQLTHDRALLIDPDVLLRHIVYQRESYSMITPTSDKVTTSKAVSDLTPVALKVDSGFVVAQLTVVR